MIEVQMRVDHESDVRRQHTDLAKRVFQLRRGAVGAAVLDTVDVVELLIFLVAGARVDQHEPRLMLHEQAPHAELDSVARVGGDLSFPERLGHDSEHRAAVQLLAACLERVHSQLPDPPP